jgi:hypothetical protein
MENEALIHGSKVMIETINSWLKEIIVCNENGGRLGYVDSVDIYNDKIRILVNTKDHPTVPQGTSDA